MKLQVIDSAIDQVTSAAAEEPSPAAGPEVLVCRLDRDGRFSQVGSACRHLLGQSAEALLGRPFADLWEVTERVAILADLSALQPTSPVMRCMLRAEPGTAMSGRLDWTVCALFDDQGRLSAHQALGCLATLAGPETAPLVPDRPAAGTVPCALPRSLTHPTEIGLCRPVAVALRASDGRAERAEARLRAALEGMGEAFVLWDADDRLVLCNRQYRTLYPEFAQQAQPGVPFATLAAILARSGQVVEARGRADAWVEERLRDRAELLSKPIVRRLADGRWVRLSGHRTADGSIVSIHTDITELKQREQALQASEARARQAESELREREAQLRGIVENIPGVVFRRERRPDGRILFPYHSPRVEERYGLTAGEIRRDPSRFIGAIHAADRAAWLQAVEESATQLTPFAMNLRLADANGEVRWVRSLARPRQLEDGTVVWDGVSLDVTELKNTEEALRESEERYRGLLEAAPIALLIHHNERISFANTRALEMFGASLPAELHGRPILSLVHPDDRDIARTRLRHLQAGGHLNPPKEMRMVRLDGAPVDVEVAAVAITEQGEPAFQVVLVDMTERKRAEARIQHLAHHDALTGLPNRALLQERLERAVVQAKREQHQVAVVMLDLDRFKEVNDSFGHPGGDQLMRAVAERLRRTIRASDTLARFGGDEFVLVQGGLRNPSGARTLAQKIVATLAEPFELDGHEVHTGASVGIALFPTDGDTPDRLIKHADLALYRAKARGRNRIEFFVSEMNRRAHAQKTLEADLRVALEEDQLTLAFQPRYELASRRLMGVQALIRWRHPEQGLIGKRRLLSIAEASGLIRPLGRWLLETACRQARVWWDAGTRCPVSVDLMPLQCRQPNLLEQVDGALANSGLAPDLLELGITEALLPEPGSAQTDCLFLRLAARGIGLGVAGFGTGRWSLTQLRQLPIARIEVDRSLIRALGSDTEGEAVVRAVVSLGRSLGNRTVANGIETEAQLHLLAGLGCDEGHGPWLGAPLLAAQVGYQLTRETDRGRRPEPQAPAPIALRA